MVKEKIVNGVDIYKLHDAIKGFRENPELAILKHRAKNEWINGPHSRTTIKDFYGAGKEQTHKTSFVLDTSAPPALLGEDEGPSATEALLYALASCLNTALIYHAAAQGVQVKELKFDMEGELNVRGFLGIDPNVRTGYQKIKITCKLKADAPPEKLQELCQLAQKYSPVFDMVTHTVPVSVNLET